MNDLVHRVSPPVVKFPKAFRKAAPVTTALINAGLVKVFLPCGTDPASFDPATLLPHATPSPSQPSMAQRAAEALKKNDAEAFDGVLDESTAAAHQTKPHFELSVLPLPITHISLKKTKLKKALRKLGERIEKLVLEGIPKIHGGELIGLKQCFSIVVAENVTITEDQARCIIVPQYRPPSYKQ